VTTEFKQALPTKECIAAETSAIQSAEQALDAAKRRLSATNTTEKNQLPSAEDIKKKKNQKNLCEKFTKINSGEKNQEKIAQKKFMIINSGEKIAKKNIRKKFAQIKSDKKFRKKKNDIDFGIHFGIDFSKLIPSKKHPKKDI